MSNLTIDTQPKQHNHCLIDCIGRVFIIAYKEQTAELEAALTKEGFECQVLRQTKNPEFQNFSPSYLCLLNHRNAWERASQLDKPTIIIEADFVPVVGFGKLPLPFNPSANNVGVSWLYTCAPQLYYVSEGGYAQGYSASTVAYIVNPRSAKYLLELADEIKENIGATKYSTWDSSIDQFLRDRQLKNYIPWRNYGEHGGLPNPEHRQNKLSKVHRADVLYGKLAFTPMYIQNQQLSILEYTSVRLSARVKGIIRLLMGRFLRPPIVKGSATPERMLRFAILRQFSWRL